MPLQCENVFVYGLAVVFKHPVNKSNVNENMFAVFFKLSANGMGRED